MIGSVGLAAPREHKRYPMSHQPPKAPICGLKVGVFLCIDIYKPSLLVAVLIFTG